MTLRPGDRLGPYEVVAPLGAGGMGEVYRAHDTRLGRHVALKVLPESVSHDAASLARFDREAKAVAALSHPNILALFDVGTHDGTAFAVTELLEGETLRERLRAGALGVRKTLDVASAVARGLAAAHDKGIVHRDLKPENLFLTTEGGVKILDFGLARHATSAPDGVSTLTTAEGTAPGTVLGTVGYMAPEQVRGETATARTDLFALGVVLYEMLSGTNPFRRGTPAETMTAILREEPADPASSITGLPPTLSRITMRCLEKRAEERFQSARDLAFALESASWVSAPSGISATAETRLLRTRGTTRIALTVAAVIAALFLGRAWGLRGSAPVVPGMSQLTWRNGYVLSGRFAADGETVVYGARWETEPTRLYSARLGSVESRPLDIGGTILSVSTTGEMALLLGTRYDGNGMEVCGTLAQVSLAGGAPRPLMDAVRGADWSPDGRELAVVRCGDVHSLEFPVGRSIATAPALAYPRVSPDGSRVAAMAYVSDASRGSVIVIDRQGKRTELTETLFRPRGLAWSPSGDEIWFTYQESRGATAIEAVTVSGKRRVLARLPEFAVLQDVTRSGRVLATNERVHVHAVASTPSTGSIERDLSWLDGSNAMDMTPDGGSLLIWEAAAAGGKDFTSYLRPTDGSAAVRIGEGEAWAISPDGKWVLMVVGEDPRRLVSLPVGSGTSRNWGSPELVDYEPAWRKNDEVVFAASNRSGERHLYTQTVGTPPERVALAFSPRAASEPGTRSFACSPDGSQAVVRRPDGAWIIYSFASSASVSTAGLRDDDQLVFWARDGVYAQRINSLDVERIDIQTGRRTAWRRLAPADLTGVDGTALSAIKDANTYAYTYLRGLSHLAVLEGLR